MAYVLVMIKTNQEIIITYFCLGENSKDKAYKITADYPYTANSVKVVLSISQSLYTSKTLDVSTESKIK